MTAAAGWLRKAVTWSKEGRQMGLRYRRRIKTEEKAKVVVSVWVEEFIPSLAALAILPRTILNSSFSFKSSWCNSSYNSNCPVHNS